MRAQRPRASPLRTETCASPNRTSPAISPTTITGDARSRRMATTQSSLEYRACATQRWRRREHPRSSRQLRRMAEAEGPNPARRTRLECAAGRRDPAAHMDADPPGLPVPTYLTGRVRWFPVEVMATFGPAPNRCRRGDRPHQGHRHRDDRRLLATLVSAPFPWRGDPVSSIAGWREGPAGHPRRRERALAA
jgi:hypothetical protein